MIHKLSSIAYSIIKCYFCAFIVLFKTFIWLKKEGYANLIFKDGQNL